LVDETGAVDTFFRASKSPELWVRFSTALRASETRSLRVVYHGDLNHFRLAWAANRCAAYPHASWPAAGHAGRRRPARDQPMVLHERPEHVVPTVGPPDIRRDAGRRHGPDVPLPGRYRLASIGRLVESRTDRAVQTTHWVAERPTAEASFNIGAFDESEIRDPRIPPVTVQVNTEGHRALRASGFFGGLNPERT